MAVNATAVWRVRPSGNNANGGGFDSAIASAGTDRSQQNAAQVTFNGTSITASTAGVGATITITGYTPVAADIANCLHITGGTNFIAGWYFITASGGGTWTLDRNCTSGAGSAMTGAMGGGWADPITNMTSSGPTVAGNTIYILGSGVPNPAAYTTDYTISTTTVVHGDNVSGFITYANDPNTPSYKAPPDTTGGMPVINVSDARWMDGSPTFIHVTGLWLTAGASNSGGVGIFNGPVNCVIDSCVYDENGFDSTFGKNIQNTSILNCEIFNYAGAGSGGSTMITLYAGNNIVSACNIHDCICARAFIGYSGVVSNCIVAKNNGDAFEFSGGSAAQVVVINCTIDGNTGSGISITTANGLSNATIFNNIISNHTTAGKFGLTVTVGTAAANQLLKAFADFNVFYNNTANYNAINAGAHDTSGGSNPYVGQTTENYTLA